MKNMTSNYVLIQEKETGLGQIAVAQSVIEHIVSLAVVENGHLFLAHKKAVDLENKDGQLVVNLELRVQYGQDVDQVCHDFQEYLERNLELMIDYKNTEINISVIGFKFD